MKWFRWEKLFESLLEDLIMVLISPEPHLLVCVSPSVLFFRIWSNQLEFYSKSNLVFTLQQGITKAAVNASIYTNFACSVAPVLGGGTGTCSSTKSGTGVSTGVRRAAQHLKANPRVPAGYRIILTITDGKANTLYDPITSMPSANSFTFTFTFSFDLLLKII